jgi:hypothetical protein
MSQEAEKKVLADTAELKRDELLDEGRRLFDTLSAADSGIRGFSEATRENTAGEYNRVATANAFEAGVSEDVDRLGQIAEKFAHVPKEP